MNDVHMDSFLNITLVIHNDHFWESIKVAVKHHETFYESQTEHKGGIGILNSSKQREQESFLATVPDRQRSSAACVLKVCVVRWCAYPRLYLSVGRCRQTPLGTEVPG